MSSRFHYAAFTTASSTLQETSSSGGSSPSQDCSEALETYMSWRARWVRSRWGSASASQEDQREPKTRRRIWTMRLSIELAIFACVFLLGWIFSHGLLHGLLDSTWTGYEILIGAALMVWLMMRYYRN